MASRWLFAPLFLILLVCSCSGTRASLVDSFTEDPDFGTPTTPDASRDASLSFPDAAPLPPDFDAPCGGCVDPALCCPKESMKCYGDPDKGVVCTCPFLWDCSQDPGTCYQDAPMPTPNDLWVCSWQKAAYTCTTGPAAPDLTAVASSWSCTQDASLLQWTCVMVPSPNPCNKQHGVNWWTCVVVPSKNRLTCTKNAS